jgi:NDP-sugar pyrophosphorylase family protein
MLNIVVPMAGRGSRFSLAGYQTPKPLIPVWGRPMTEIVIDNLRPSQPHVFTFLILREHSESFNLDKHLRVWSPNCRIVFVDSVTQGAACTVLLCREYIENNDPLMIANCDQYIELSIDTYLHHMIANNLDGLIMTMRATDPKWSYIGCDERQRVRKVVEKKVISNEATVGIYNF